MNKINDIADLGKILVNMRALTETKLIELLEKFRSHQQKCNFNKFLMEHGDVSNDQINIAILRQRTSKKRK